MTELQAAGMQVQARRRTLAVEGITQDRVPQRLQMHTQLMGASRQGLQRQATAAGVLRRQAPVGSAGFTGRVDAIERRPVLSLGDRMINPALLAIGNAGDIGDVALLNPALGKGLAQGAVDQR